MNDMNEQRVALVPNGGWDPRILVCRYGTLVDVFVIVTARYVVLVDTLLGPDTAAQLLTIAAPHLHHGRQLLVVNTHSHYDHAWGNALFAGPDAAHPAPIIGTERCAARLRAAAAHADLAERQRADPQTFGATTLVPPTICCEDQLLIDGGDLTLHLIRTPGHAPDHLAVWLPEIRTLLAGDAAETPFPFAETAATLDEIQDSLRRMAALEPTTVLYCHAPGVTSPALLHANLAYFAKLEELGRRALAGGAPIPTDDGALEAFVGFPFADALPPGAAPDWQPEFYRPGHQAHLRMALSR